MHRPVPLPADRSLREDFQRGSIGSTIVGGVVAGVVAVALSVSLAAFVFRDDLAGDLDVGVGVILAATVVIGLTTALRSSLPGSIAGVQNVTAAVLGVAAAGVAASAGPGERLGSVLAFMIFATFATGLFLWGLGRFRLGALVRFVPYTVIGGFIAATGYLIAVGAFGILTGSPSGEVQVAAVAAPAMLIGLGLLVAERREAPLVSLPVTIVTAVIALHAVFLIAGVSVTEAAARGWLLGGGAARALWTPATLTELANVDVSAVVGQLGGIPTVALVAALALLLNLHSLETEVDRDLDLDRELRVAGIGNMLAAGVGGGPGYTYLSNTLLLARLGALRRGAALVAAVVALLAVVAGTTLLSVVPTAVTAGLLLYLGVSFILDWVWDTRTELPWLDRVVVGGIVLVVAVFGLVEGVTVGLVVAVVLFVVRYSRIDIVKHRYDVAVIRSRVDRTRAQLRWLRDHGSRVLVLELRGYLFFGTAHGLVDTVEAHRPDAGLSWVLFDLSGVTGLDSTAASAFARINRAGAEQGFGLVLACDPATRLRLIAGGIDQGDGRRAPHYAEDLDAAIAWTEDRLLELEGAPADERTASLEDFLTNGRPGDAAGRLARYFARLEVADQDRVIEQGTQTQGLFFIEAGRLTAVLETDGGPARRLLTMRAGALLGEVSLYGNSNATATVIATGPATVAHLSPQEFERLCIDDPEAAAYLHELVAKTLVDRLGRAEAAMRQLRDSP